MLKSIIAVALVAAPAAAHAAPTTVGMWGEVYHDQRSGNLIGNGRQMSTVSVRYVGLKASGQPRFARTDLKMEDVSNIHNAAPPVMLPPITVEMVVEMATDPDLHIDGRTLHILAATSSSVTYEAVNDAVGAEGR